MEEINETLIESLKAIEPAESLEQSLAKVLKAQAEEKRRHFQSLVYYFQRRYGMTAEEFYQNRIKDKKHSWEDEDTYFDWMAAQQEVQEMEEEITKLEDLLSDADSK